MIAPTGTAELADLIGPVADRFTDAGFKLYLVGGVVRDLAMADAVDGTERFHPAGNDIDLTTDARPADIKTLVGPLAEDLWTQGERFGTIGAIVGGQPLEITTHRAEAYDPESRKPIVTFGDDLQEDLSRRDFTINAAAIEIPGPILHDPFHGLADLVAGTLRTPLSPEVSFTDDPLRMMRAARFISRFDLTPEPGLVAAAEALADRLPIVSVERVSDELERLLALADPGPGLAFLDQTGLLGRIIPRYADGSVSDDDRELAVSLASAATDPLVRRAGLLWPLGTAGAGELRRLRYPKADTSLTARVLEAAATAVGQPADAELVRRAVGLVGLDHIDHVATLATLVPGPSTAFTRVLTDLRTSEDLADLDPPLSGTEIMVELGLEPGPAVGRATTMLREHRLANGPFSRAEAARLLRVWWEETTADRKQGPTIR